MDINTLRKSSAIASTIFWKFLEEFHQGKHGTHLGRAFCRRFPLSGLPHHKGLNTPLNDRALEIIFMHYTIKSETTTFSAVQHTTVIEIGAACM